MASVVARAAETYWGSVQVTVDEGAWMQFARSLVDAGAEAANAAQAHDVERVFAAGEQVYNVCTACHVRYVGGGSPASN